MEKKAILESIKKVKLSSKRNFKQTYDLIINLKDIDLKKVQINQFVTLHYTKGKKTSVCALVGPELLKAAKEVCDEAISVDDFGKYTEKSAIKKLANNHDFFIAQANVMAKIASTFGRVFGPRGRMPNPKAGCVVPPNANLQPLYDKLQKTARVQIKNSPIIQCSVGTEDMKDEEVTDNILTIYDALIHLLPNTVHNVKNSYLKLTMGSPVKIGEKEGPKAKKKTEEPETKKEEKKPEDKKEEPDTKNKEEKAKK